MIEHSGKQFDFLTVADEGESLTISTGFLSFPLRQSICKMSWKNVIGVRPTQLTKRYLSHRCSGAELKKIWVLFLLSDSGFNHASRRFEANMEAEGQLGKKVEEIREISDF